MVLKGFDSGANSPLTYLKSSHCSSVVLGIQIYGKASATAAGYLALAGESVRLLMAALFQHVDHFYFGIRGPWTLRLPCPESHPEAKDLGPTTIGLAMIMCGPSNCPVGRNQVVLGPIESFDPFRQGVAALSNAIVLALLGWLFG